MSSKHFSSKCADVKSVLKRKPLVRAIALALMAGSLAIPATGWAATDCTAVTQIPKAQCDALVSLYTSTNGAKWTDAATNNWNVTNTPCSWTGVVCSGSNVTELNRASGGLAGPLPDLSALTGLQKLWLRPNTALTGDVAILKGLTNLRVLYLGYTGLRGFLGDLSTLTQLEELYMDAVALGTPMPDLASFKKLRILNLWQSGVIGLIPSSLSSLTNLEYLSLPYNQLVGNIPNLSALTKLSYFHLGSNNLTGNIPDMSNLIRLGYAYLNNNQLSGNIPASLGSLPAPAAITLGVNKLCIPGEPLLSQLNLKVIPTGDTKWTTTQTSTNCDGVVLSVTASNGSVSCNGTTCQTSYPANTALTLTATPSSGYKFDSWGGACSGTTSCQVTMDTTKSVTANFSTSAVNYSFTTNATNGTISCNGGNCQTSYSANTALTLTATPSSGYKFDSWSGDCSGTSCQVTMTANKNVTANFSKVPVDSYALTTSATNGAVKCNGGDCQTSYAKSTQLTLTATPNNGYQFANWSGDCSGTSCQLTMTANKSVTANFTSSCTGNTCPPFGENDITTIWPTCSEHARYSIEDYTLTIPVLEIPLQSLMGDPLGESLYYETTLKQVNGTNDRFVLQEVTQLVKVEADTTCARFDLDQGLATLPAVDVKMPLLNSIVGKDYGHYTERYTVTLKWMPILGTEIFVVESINKIGEEERKP